MDNHQLGTTSASNVLEAPASEWYPFKLAAHGASKMWIDWCSFSSSLWVIHWPFFVYKFLDATIDMYYLAFPKDGVYMKCLVYGIYFLQLVQFILIIKTGFWIFVANSGVVAVFDRIENLWLSVPIFSTISEFSHRRPLTFQYPTKVHVSSMDFMCIGSVFCRDRRKLREKLLLLMVVMRPVHKFRNDIKFVPH